MNDFKFEIGDKVKYNHFKGEIIGCSYSGQVSAVIYNVEFEGWGRELVMEQDLESL
jgi:hypothetical protein